MYFNTYKPSYLFSKFVFFCSPHLEVHPYPTMIMSYGPLRVNHSINLQMLISPDMRFVCHGVTSAFLRLMKSIPCTTKHPLVN